MNDHERDVNSWREGRIARLTARDGWLSLIGKSYLERGVAQPVGSAADSGVLLPGDRAPAQLGVVELVGERVRFSPVTQAQKGLRVQRAGAAEVAVTGPIELTSDARGAADRIVYGDLVLDVMERGQTFAVRVRDLSRARPECAGIEYFALDPSWRVTARLEPYAPEKQIELLFEGGIEQPFASPGALVFEHGGTELRLDPVFESDRKRLWIVFGDPTNRDASYGAGRFLYAPLPEGGKVVLDFNCAFSPPCAFSPFVACPLPPPHHRMPGRVVAVATRPVEK